MNTRGSERERVVSVAKSFVVYIRVDKTSREKFLTQIKCLFINKKKKKFFFFFFKQ